MREFKFRAWDGDTLEMLYDDFYIDKMDDNTFYGKRDYEEDGHLVGCEVKLMQYTGLKDKQGKEIYEGDMVKIVGYEYPLQVEFARGSFVLGDSSLLVYQEDELEVVGNIFEAKENGIS